MYVVRIPVSGGRCIKYSEREARLYHRDIVICESLLMLANRLSANIHHEEYEHDAYGVYVNIYIADVGSKETLNA